MPGFLTAKYAKYAKMFCFEFRSYDRRSLRFSVGKLLVAALPRCVLCVFPSSVIPSLSFFWSFVAKFVYFAYFAVKFPFANLRNSRTTSFGKFCAFCPNTDFPPKAFGVRVLFASGAGTIFRGSFFNFQSAIFHLHRLSSPGHIQQEQSKLFDTFRNLACRHVDPPSLRATARQER